MPFCTNCGKQNPDSARFCAQCGTRLPVDDGPSVDEATATISIGTPPEKADTADRHLSPVDAAAVDALPQGSAMLVVQKGPSAGSRFLLDRDEVTAGRHHDSEIFLDDVTVSRRHAVFTREGGEFTVADVGQPQRHLRQPRPHRQGRAQGLRRGPDRQVPAGVLHRTVHPSSRLTARPWGSGTTARDPRPTPVRVTAGSIRALG